MTTKEQDHGDGRTMPRRRVDDDRTATGRRRDNDTTTTRRRRDNEATTTRQRHDDDDIYDICHPCMMRETPCPMRMCTSVSFALKIGEQDLSLACSRLKARAFPNPPPWGPRNVSLSFFRQGNEPGGSPPALSSSPLSLSFARAMCQGFPPSLSVSLSLSLSLPLHPLRERA